MRIFVAGATGAIGRSLVPLLAAAGHQVFGTSRSASRAATVPGMTPVVVDAYDAAGLRAAVVAAAPDVVIDELTDLAGEDFAGNARLRVEGTRNLVDACVAAGVTHVIAESIAWLYVAGPGAAVETDPLDPALRGYEGVAALEGTVAELPHATVLRYGTLYGPGTWYAPDGLLMARIRSGEYVPPHAWTSFVHVDDAAAATVAALDWPAGPVNVVDDEPTADWPALLGAQVPAGEPSGRPISNAKARSLGWQPKRPRFSL